MTDKDFKVKLSTGNTWVVIEPVHGVAFYRGYQGCMVNADRTKTRLYLENYLHELYHLIRPDADDKEVTRVTKDLATVLWKRGYRLTKSKKKRKSK